MAHLNEKQGTIILLNGPSSVGKTSIQNAFQKMAEDYFLRAGIDTFFDALIETPDLSSFQETKKFDQYTPQGEYIRGVEMTHDDQNRPIVTLKIGPAGDRIIHGMHRAILGYALAGNNIIVDYILYKTSWINDLLEVFEGHRIYLIGVSAPLSLVEEREKSRATSPVGHARSHYDSVHQSMIYDYQIDTSMLSPEEAAEDLLEFIRHNKPQALEEMHFRSMNLPSD